MARADLGRPRGAGYLGITGCRGCSLLPVAEEVSTPGPRLRSSSSTSPVIPSTTLPQENMHFLKWFKYCNLENLHIVLAKQLLSAPERLHPAPAPQQAPALPACAGGSRVRPAFTHKNNDTCAGMFSVALCASALNCLKLQQGVSYV